MDRYSDSVWCVVADLWGLLQPALRAAAALCEPRLHFQDLKSATTEEKLSDPVCLKTTA